MAHIAPGLSEEETNLNSKQVCLVAFSIYFCFIAFVGLTFMCLYNIYAFLYRQSKWRVFPLTLFYCLALLCLLIRTVETLFTV